MVNLGGGLKYSASGSRLDSEEEMQVTTKSKAEGVRVALESNSPETWRLHRRGNSQSVFKNSRLRLLTAGSDKPCNLSGASVLLSCRMEITVHECL